MKYFVKKMLAVICVAVFGMTFVNNIMAEAATVTENVPRKPKWYAGNMVVAHALGNIDGRSETNSLEALEESYARGFRVFETDIILSSDDALVLRHDFEADSYYNLEQNMDATPVMSKNEFLNTPICGIYTPMLFETLVDFMIEHKDVYIVTDTKNTDAATVTKQFKKLKEVVDSKNNPEIYSRIIVQLYNYDMKAVVDRVCKFDNYIFTVYKLPEVDYNKLASYCKQNNIDVVVMPVERVSKEKNAILHNSGITVFAHTVNRILLIKSLNLYHGVDGVYTDYVSPNDMTKLGYQRIMYAKK